MKLAVPALLASAAAVAVAEHDPSIADLVAWFNAREGTYHNPKQEIRYEVPGDTTTMLGVFAKERIEKGEMLISVPWNSTINADRDIPDPPPLVCKTVRKLIREMRKGEESDFAPYVLYLLKQRHGQVPSSWSEEGKDLFEEILAGDDLPPNEPLEWVERDWRQDCEGSEDPFEENAAMLVVQRAEDDIMLPVYDMFNHRNGYYLNTKNDYHPNEKFDVEASRDIEKGEQIYISYNMCSNCAGRANDYGTAEIFRDYGFVEQYPQRWIFNELRFAFDLEEKEDGSGELEVFWDKNGPPKKGAIESIQRHILRLEKLKKLEEDNEEVPEYELRNLWEYTDALVLAMKSALRAARGGRFSENACIGGDLADGTCPADGYDALNDEEDDLFYEVITCDNKQILKFKEYDHLEDVESIYQSMTFVENKEEDDVCLDIEDTVQICANYRPHYHEFMVDFPGRYLETIRNVIFVGGGDSMLLDEALKYPSIERVVGLELDQVVVRKSFKYFHTQPHFDDDRVEWWFGDAAKSLLMLPKDYFGSFDLVLVDLSETVMSFAVTKTLDMLEALALLLNPGGIMIKNELYLEKMSTILDYTAQTYFQDVPMICDQAMVMGSNNIDFFNDERKDHGVKTLLLQPLDQIENRFDIFHDYRKNDARAQGKCGDLEDQSDDSNRLGRHPGILMIVDVEDTTVPLLPLAKIEGALSKALQKEGLSPLSTVAPLLDDGGVVAVIVMKEGYVVARVWPDHEYCAFDIHLWGRFNKMKNVRDALVAAVGSSTTSTSSFRIVVGGMLGTSTWNKDQKSIGPRNIQMRNCDERATKVGYISDQETIGIALEETLTLLQDDGVVAAVLCGVEGEACRSLDVVTKSSKFRHVIPLWTCPDVAKDPQYSEAGADRMLNCEGDTVKTLRKAVAQWGEISAFIVDASVPFPMVKIANSVWSSQRNQMKLLQLTDQLLFIVMMPDHNETWRKKHNFLDRTRKHLKYDPLFAAELVLSSGDGKMEIGVLSSEDTDFFRHLDGVARNVEKRSSLDVEVRKVQGALWRHQTNFTPQKFKANDYDLRLGKEQFFLQKSFGRQSVFQLDRNAENSASRVYDPISTALVRDTLARTLLKMEYPVTEMRTFTDIGDGSVVVAAFPEGSAIVVWDGSTHVDINLFTYDDSEENASKFAEVFMKLMKGMKMALRDEMPRGIGRVINFSADME